MSNVYTPMHIHFVFAPRFRASLIDEHWERELYNYITEIVQGQKCKMHCINGIPNHLHMAVGINVNISIDNFMQRVMTASSDWVNEKNLADALFEWQTGYAAISSVEEDLPELIAYIAAQKQYHQWVSFLDEYKVILTTANIDFNEDDIFKEPE